LRLDSYLVEKSFAKSRERAKEHIKKGEVSVNGSVVVKPSFEVTGNEQVVFSGEKLKYVGRGGLKLEKALDSFNIELNGRVCIDIGASTGGFTDCMLQNGAKKVYAVDVGHDQLDASLIQDKRVINMEKTNINDVSIGMFEPTPEFVSVDVSFVSLKNEMPKIAEFIRCGKEAVILIKPQFEAGKSAIGKNGIVKDRKVHAAVLNDIVNYISECGLSVKELTYSPISGGDGNIEYLAHVVNEKCVLSTDIRSLVECSFSSLKK